MAATGLTRRTWGYMIIVLMTFAVLQSVVVVMHEFTHSTVAWLLGYTQSPFGIVWGNPLTMTGWDEIELPRNKKHRVLIWEAPVIQYRWKLRTEKAGQDWKKSEPGFSADYATRRR